MGSLALLPTANLQLCSLIPNRPGLWHRVGGPCPNWSHVLKPCLLSTLLTLQAACFESKAQIRPWLPQSNLSTAPHSLRALRLKCSFPKMCLHSPLGLCLHFLSGTLLFPFSSLSLANSYSSFSSLPRYHFPVPLRSNSSPEFTLSVLYSHCLCNYHSILISPLPVYKLSNQHRAKWTRYFLDE